MDWTTGKTQNLIYRLQNNYKTHAHVRIGTVEAKPVKFNVLAMVCIVILYRVHLLTTPAFNCCIHGVTVHIA